MRLQALYMEIKKFPIKETEELNPKNIYGLSKKLMNKYLIFTLIKSIGWFKIFHSLWYLGSS